jgi:hypothetical protein
MFGCCVLSGRGLCDELITRPEESYRLRRVVVCDQETSWHEEAIARAGLQSQRNKQGNQIAWLQDTKQISVVERNIRRKTRKHVGGSVSRRNL